MRFSCATVAASLFFFVFFPLQSLFAWNDTGHMLVAKIAYEKLKPEARAKIDKIIAAFNQDYPEINDFQQLACWPDTIRSQRIDMYSHWHYIDQALVRDGGIPVNLVDTDNVIWAINKLKAVVRNDHANPYERARFLAFFIHVIGDIHQPLHTVSLITPNYPTGDQGGNLYYIYYNNKHINLHKLWDDGLGLFSNRLTPEQVTAMSNQISARYTEAYFSDRLRLLSAEDWAKEGSNLASTYVYATPLNQVPTQQYIDAGRKVVEEQVAIGGYRLAQALNELMG
jgi:hypothetical protein